MSECVTVWIAGFKSNASLIIPCRYINDGGKIVIFDIKLKKYSFNYKTNLVVRRPCDSFSSSAAFKDESNISCMLPSSLPICLKLLKNDGVEPAESTLSSCPYKCIFPTVKKKTRQLEKFLGHPGVTIMVSLNQSEISSYHNVFRGAFKNKNVVANENAASS